MSRRPLLAIAAPVRAEAPYLVEWIAYHRALGIDLFILGDNGGDDGTSELIGRLERQRLVVRLDWQAARYFQLAFYEQAIAVARLFARGLFLVDVDEFLRPLGGETSVAAVAGDWLADESIGAVALNWAVYGSDGRTAPGEGLVIERFTRRAPREFGPNRHAKAFARVAACAGIADNPHAVALSRGRYVDPAGRDVVWDDGHGFATGITAEVVWERLRVDHFVLKSRAEFERKKGRGDVISPVTEAARRQEAYFQAHDRNEVDEPTPAWLVDRTRAGAAEIARALAQ